MPNGQASIGVSPLDLVSEWTDEPAADVEIRPVGHWAKLHIDADASAAPSPVRKVTRTEIVEGKYGRLSIAAHKEGVAVAVLDRDGNPTSQHAFAVILNASEARSIIATLTAILPALDAQEQEGK
jgi:hypothetical protein